MVENVTELLSKSSGSIYNRSRKTASFQRADIWPPVKDGSARRMPTGRGRGSVRETMPAIAAQGCLPLCNPCDADNPPDMSRTGMEVDMTKIKALLNCLDRMDDTGGGRIFFTQVDGGWKKTAHA